MDVEVSRRPTARHDAGVTVPLHDLAADRIGDVRFRPRQLVALEVADEHRVADQPLRRDVVDRNLLAIDTDEVAFASLARGDCHLHRRLRDLIGTGRLCLTKQPLEKLVVGQPLAVLLVALAAQPPIARPHRRRDLEEDLLLDQLRIRIRLRAIAAPQPGDHALDIARRPAMCLGEELVLVLRRRHPRQLAHRREAQLAGLELLVDQRQRHQLARDPQPLVRRVRPPVELALHVLEHRRVAEPPIQLRLVGLDQQTDLLRLERDALLRERSQSPVQLFPVCLAQRRQLRLADLLLLVSLFRLVRLVSHDTTSSSAPALRNARARTTSRAPTLFYTRVFGPPGRALRHQNTSTPTRFAFDRSDRADRRQTNPRRRNRSSRTHPSTRPQNTSSISKL